MGGCARPTGVPPRLLGVADEDRHRVRFEPRHPAADWPAAQTAALRIAQNQLDLRLLHDRVIDVDLARLRCGRASFR